MGVFYGSFLSAERLSILTRSENRRGRQVKDTLEVTN